MSTLPFAAVASPLDELAGVAAAVWRGGQAPRYWLQGEDGNGRPVARDTLWRIASVSKLAQALVAQRLQQRGAIDLAAPLSPLLGFPLRHPDGHAPSALDLLSHQAGLRDDGDDGLNLPLAPLSPAVLAPLWGARRFAYANLNSVVLGTALERLGGQRYDDLLQAELFGPLGIEAAFDPSRLSREQQRRVACLQRRVDGRWQAQTPSLQQQAAAPRVPADYQPGRNCVGLGPQGNLHIGLDGLVRLAEALRRRDPALLPAPGHAELARPLWQGQSADNGLFRAWSAGLQCFTDTPGGDRLHPRGGFHGIGHLGEAYGLLSGLIVQPETESDPGWGLVFVLHGTREPLPRGAHSAFSRWEESLLQQLLDKIAS
jgi:CubicO group peptidase (beta-lactamase class C family)